VADFVNGLASSIGVKDELAKLPPEIRRALGRLFGDRSARAGAAAVVVLMEG
jgi:hypothetical protein